MASDGHAKSPIAVVVLAAGAGTRMKSALPKVPPPAGRMADGAPCAGERRPAEARPDRRRGGAGAADEVAAVRPASRRWSSASRSAPGDAAKAALPALKGHRGPVLVVLCRCAPDHDARRCSAWSRPAARPRPPSACWASSPRDPSPYGRLIVRDGMLERIVESTRCQCGRKGDRLLQFRRDVPRRLAIRN